MELSITQAWELLDRIRRNRESWSFDLGDEGGIKIDYDCLRAFQQTGEVNAIANDFYLDPNIVLHILQCFLEQINTPKKDWIRYEPPPQPPKEVHIIYAPLGPPRERPPIVDPLLLGAYSPGRPTA
jgi:hypothetical protein